ncbi:transcriptional regulator, BlaI/MecI/CopY family [Desulfitobacterium hafniense DP7]|uniref:Transcriptional regulator, BlaI/MecI/CopY family n=1 Tax=Desulfitobacterium hafniense DP7 TaxID=537010 RepID=G9XL37_DESHA|nr:BlaI/MecI/CopY family transcriptional regulator [Desulfitobacterium hafniense]EHL07554.1 transcriptional regulator, BlaI/MecI/CopY family [Desulfitobacterium hafniense DP7]
MGKDTLDLTKNELEIMSLMWTQHKPLSRSEIIDLSPERSWKASSIHILLNQLLEKEAIVVDGYVKTGKNYGRTYSAAITPEEYQAMQIKQGAAFFQSKSAALTSLVSELIKDEDIDDETLDRLEAILREKRRNAKL